MGMQKGKKDAGTKRLPASNWEEQFVEGMRYPKPERKEVSKQASNRVAVEENGRFERSRLTSTYGVCNSHTLSQAPGMLIQPERSAPYVHYVFSVPAISQYEEAIHLMIIEGSFDYGDQTS